MDNVVVYSHAGSTNHGCEALLRTTVSLINYPCQVFSIAGDDYLFDANRIANYTALHTFKSYSWQHFALKMKSILNKSKMPYVRYWYKDCFDELRSNPPKLAVAIGGDAYCYGNNAMLINQNKMFNSFGSKTVLWGCSIEPELLNDEEIIEDFNRYAVIIAREHITEKAILNSSVRTRVLYGPDPAFSLPIEEIALPFSSSNVIAINVSPMVQRHEKVEGIVWSNYCYLLESILEETSFEIALIPHVVTEGGSDLGVLRLLFEKYKETGRVYLIDENSTMNCMQLKFALSRCRFAVVARTHASIAAYSCCVPTLVMGYSIKAKGIACDLFGDDKEYVISSGALKSPSDLWDAFVNILENEESIKATLENRMIGILEELQIYSDTVTDLICK